jgi:putative heme transporter
VVNGFNKLSVWLNSGPLTEWLRNGPLHVNAAWLDSSTWVTRITDFLKESGSTIATYAAEFGTQVGHFLAGLALALFALFYFIYDGRGIFTFLLKFFPRTSRDRVDQAALRGWRSLSSYVRATILVALVDSIGVLIVALILGVPVAPALAALVFLGAFVPIVGALVSGSVAVLVALVALGWVQALIMLGGVILVMQIEGHVLQPFLLGRAVKLHPLAVLISIAIGIIVGGIVGALLAVPLLAFTKSFVLSLAGGAEPPLGKMHPPALPLHRRSPKAAEAQP